MDIFITYENIFKLIQFADLLEYASKSIKQNNFCPLENCSFVWNLFSNCNRPSYVPDMNKQENISQFMGRENTTVFVPSLTDNKISNKPLFHFRFIP